MGSEKSAPAQAPLRKAVAFAGGREADRRVAGVSAAARVVHNIAQSGAGEIWLIIGEDKTVSAATLADIERLRGTTEVRIVSRAEAPADLPATPAPAMDAMTILRATAKPGDGLVSRYFNRPISQRISWAVLAIPGVRPIHATIAAALFSLVMFWGLLEGGKAGLILGGILFQAASVNDGVDGEMARATYRATDFGKTLDSAIDMATNVLFVLALTLHLGRHGPAYIHWLGFWSLGLMVTGAVLIGWRTRAGGAPLSFDMLKRSGPVHNLVDLIYWMVQALTGRDVFAFLFMVLIILGLAHVGLMIFAGVGTIWIFYVFVTLVLPRSGAGFRGAA
jgi:CDP-L-myo-inositol myo-inositolphosphotransferase